VRTVRRLGTMWATGSLLCGAVLARAQADTSGEIASAQIVEQARALLTRGNADSAAVLLRRLADAPSRPTSERVQAGVLLGIALYYAQGPTAAAPAFQQALALDPGLEVTGLDQLDPEIRRLVAEARGQRSGNDVKTTERPTQLAEGSLYDCIKSCPAGVVRPQFSFVPDMGIAESAVLPSRRSRAFLLMRAVVNAAGVIEPETLEFVSGTAQGVEPQVRQALLQARFRPGLFEGRAVRTRVHLRFDFEAEGIGTLRYTYQVVGR